jgi:hypothetical protein
LLGIEQLNFVSKPNPIFLEGLVAIRVSEQMARDLGLKDNQVIRGVIENRGDLLKLILNNREIDWPGSKRFKPGDRIDFRVEGSVYGRSLKPIASAQASPTSPSIAPSARLLSLIYRPDQPMVTTQLLQPASLSGLLTQLAASDQTQQLSQLMQSMGRLSPEMIKNALVHSGLFGEFFLSGQSHTGPDLKQWLRGLLRFAMAQSQTQVVVELEAAIDNLESRQLDSLQAQLNRELSYSFTLPFVDANPVEVQFERGPYDSDQGEADWVINLHTESQELGELWLKTTLRPDDSLEMIMWAERAAVAQLARTATSELEYELQSFGLQLNKITVLNAARPGLDPALSSPGHVVDVRT